MHVAALTAENLGEEEEEEEEKEEGAPWCC